ncbi:MAG: hypothetical protein GY948_05955 [Alphaproteobacteria bacterium]|nr:hypothetical protein [Alphaproteobacteria bacterium]
MPTVFLRFALLSAAAANVVSATVVAMITVLPANIDLKRLLIVPILIFFVFGSLPISTLGTHYGERVELPLNLPFTNHSRRKRQRAIVRLPQGDFRKSNKINWVTNGKASGKDRG